jgi:hypothetical protein
MIIRPLTKDDYPLIAWLNERQDFKLHHLGNHIIDRIVFDDHGPAYGIVKKIGEPIILVNPDASLATRSKALRELMKYAEFGAVQYGCEQLHCFVSDERVARILERHFGFIRTKDIVLSKNL